MNLRPYQSQIVSAVEAGWKDYRRQLIVVPTGGGKTIVFSHLAMRQPGRTLILAHREELIDQAIDKLHTATGISAEKEKAEFEASLSARVVVASFQTMARRLDKWPKDHFALVVADEAHHAVAPSQQVVLQHFNARVLGVTATPNRSDAKNLGEFFENIAAQVNLLDLTKDGYLAPIVTEVIPVKIDLTGARTLAGDYNDADLGHAIEPYLESIVAHLKRTPGRRTLVFLPLIATSMKFVEIANRAGLNFRHIDGQSPNRRQLLDSFAAWEFDGLSNAMLLTEGYDEPSIDRILCLRPTKSDSLYFQIVGRGTRVDPLKENLLVSDCLWHHEKHGRICRPAHLVAKSDEEADVITQLAQERAAAMPGDVAEQLPLDLLGLASDAQAKREESLRKKLAEHSKKDGKFISAEEFAMSHHSLAVAEYEPTMRWERDEPTKGQKFYLRKAGIDLETVSCKGHAKQLLDIYFKNKPLTLASEGQRRIMARMRHPNADHATDDEARKFFEELNRKKKAAATV